MPTGYVLTLYRRTNRRLDPSSFIRLEQQTSTQNFFLTVCAWRKSETEAAMKQLTPTPTQMLQVNGLGDAYTWPPLGETVEWSQTVRKTNRLLLIKPID